MKQCPICNTEHAKPGKYCSKECSYKRVVSEETRRKRSKSLTGNTSNKSTMTADALQLKIEKTQQTWLRKYRSTPFNELGFENKRRRVFEEQLGCCNNCGINEWLGRKITLELEHKDGNNQNNDRDNLEGLCPNCHSITLTWRGRNKPAKNGRPEISDAFLLECLTQTDSIRQGLLKAGLSAKGNNYVRAKRLLGQ